MDYETAIQVIRNRILEKNEPAYGGIVVSPEDFDPAPSPKELYDFCFWLDREGYTKTFPGQGTNNKWHIHPSSFAKIEWDITEPDS